MDYNTNYERWLNHPAVDEAMKAELASMGEKEKEDAFYTNVEFGTAGMRGILGPGDIKFKDLNGDIRKCNRTKY